MMTGHIFRQWIRPAHEVPDNSIRGVSSHLQTMRKTMSSNLSRLSAQIILTVPILCLKLKPSNACSELHFALKICASKDCNASWKCDMRRLNKIHHSSKGKHMDIISTHYTTNLIHISLEQNMWDQNKTGNNFLKVWTSTHDDIKRVNLQHRWGNLMSSKILTSSYCKTINGSIRLTRQQMVSMRLRLRPKRKLLYVRMTLYIYTWWINTKCMHFIKYVRYQHAQYKPEAWNACATYSCLCFSNACRKLSKQSWRE